MRLLSLQKKTLNAIQNDNAQLRKQVEQKGEVSLLAQDEGIVVEGDGGKEWIAEQVLKALDYGFEPKQAFKLFKDQYFLDVIDLEQAFRGHSKKIERYKARVIGEGGKAKKKLQELSGAFLAVSDNEVALLGEYEEVRLAKEAVLRLLEGAEHNGVYAFIEKQRQKNRWL